MDEKIRTVPLLGSRTWSGKGPNEPSLTTFVSSPVTFVQRTQSRGHAWPSAKRGRSDCGGDFSTARITNLSLPYEGNYNNYNFGYQYVGGEYVIRPDSAVSEALKLVSFTPDVSLYGKGTTAIANSLPTNPVADAGTFLGELKEGLPKLAGKQLFKSKFKDYRKYGSEYLNIEFGWKPLVADLQKFAKATIESDKILEQLRRDSGKNIRRKYTFPDEVSITRQEIAGSQSANGSGLKLYSGLYNSSSGSILTIDRMVRTETWFSGCFSYHLMLGNTLPERMARMASEARKLYGIELTPETVWNLAPWSWAVDWEGNIGDVLHNMSQLNKDGLVMRYGYIMQKKTAQVNYTLNWGGRMKTSPRVSLTGFVTAESRIRRRATPFGFGFDMATLTGRQSAILGALGISRGPRHL